MQMFSFSGRHVVLLTLHSFKELQTYAAKANIAQDLNRPVIFYTPAKTTALR